MLASRRRVGEEFERLGRVEWGWGPAFANLLDAAQSAESRRGLYLTREEVHDSPLLSLVGDIPYLGDVFYTYAVYSGPGYPCRSSVQTYR